jgi:hypothetical protein
MFSPDQLKAQAVQDSKKPGKKNSVDPDSAF